MLCLWVLREINSRFCSKTQWQMFLLISGRHVGAHLGGHQHGGSIQISINLGKTFLLISSVRKIAVTWILARVFAYLLSFYFQILDFLDWTVFVFYFDLLWMAWHWKPAIWSVLTNRATKLPPHNFRCGIYLLLSVFHNLYEDPRFLFKALFGTKVQLDRFRVFLEDTATARQYCYVVWSWRNFVSKQGWYVR